MMKTMGKTPARRHRPFVPKFKAEIVECRRSADHSIGHVAEDLDLTKTAVRESVK